MLEQPSHASEAQDNRPERDAFERRIAERYDMLLEERRRLQASLENCKARYLNPLIHPEDIPDQEIRAIVSDFRERLASETSFLEPLEKLGIDVLAEDLSVQPSFPDVRIEFASSDIVEHNVRDRRQYAGTATGKDKVRIGDQQVPLRPRLVTFARTGVFDSATKALAHELVHIRNEVNGPTDVEELDEANAYFNGLFVGDQHSIGAIISMLSEQTDDASEITYGFEREKASKAALAVASMYALGADAETISKLVATSKFEESTRTFEPIESALLDMKRAACTEELDEDTDMMALYDLFRLHATNQRLKARLALFASVKDVVPEEKLRVFLERRARTQIAIPTYRLEGQEVFADRFQQRVMFPCNAEYPYSVDGVRSGIVFGFFPESPEAFRSGSWEHAPFNLGRIEIEDGLSPVLKLAASDDERSECLARMEEAAKNVTLEFRTSVLESYIEGGVLEKAPLSLEYCAPFSATRTNSKPSLSFLI